MQRACAIAEPEKTIRRLLRASLVFRSSEDRDRFRMLRPVRSYARMTLQSLPEASESKSRYIDFFTKYAGEHQNVNLPGNSQLLGLEWLNILQASRLAGELDQYQKLLSLADSMRIWFYLSVHSVEASEIQERTRLAANLKLDTQTEANCIQRLGDIALARSDHETARARYEEARLMYRQVGSVQGEANCIQGFGNTHLKLLQSEAATKHFLQAIEMYRNFGDIEGEGECLRGLGDAALQQADFVLARQKYDEANILFARIQNPHFIGEIHQRLARIADSEAEKRSHVAAAREAWSSIGFDHLVAELDTEFGV